MPLAKVPIGLLTAGCGCNWRNRSNPRAAGPKRASRGWEWSKRQNGRLPKPANSSERCPFSRRAVGTAVFGGMLAASSIGIFLVPMLYMTFQRMRERVKLRFSDSGRSIHRRATLKQRKHGDKEAAN